MRAGLQGIYGELGNLSYPVLAKLSSSDLADLWGNHVRPDRLYIVMCTYRSREKKEKK